jgi:hypothetical protein
MYEDVAGEERPTVNSFSAMRNYLLLRVMMASGQRCEAASAGVYNLTIYEFSNGVWTEGKQRVYITRTLRHKKRRPAGQQSCYGMSS